MNIQTEHLENHSARITVEIAPERLEKAKNRAAKQLSKQYRIPGFRKGKAPYRIIAQYIGEPVIIERAIDDMTQEVYREALDGSDVAPYGPGAVEDFKLDPPTFVFTLPLVPEIETGDYRSVRLDFEAPEVEDEDVDNAMKALQQQEALVEESAEPVAAGNRVVIDIHSNFLDGDERPSPEDDAADDEAEETSDDVAESEDTDVEATDEAVEDVSDETDEPEDAEPEAETPVWYKGDPFIHEHDATLQLDEGETIIIPGFAQALEGTNLDEEVVFSLTVPDGPPEGKSDDDVLYKDIYGRNIEFNVTVKQIETVTTPELNDDFANRFTKDDEESLTLLELRIRTRADLEKEALAAAETDYAEEVLSKMLEGADLAYPDEMLIERLEDMLKEFEGQLAQQNLNLDTYYQVTGSSQDDLYDQFEPQAIHNLERSLMLGEVMQAENLRVDADEVGGKIEEMLGELGENAEMFRTFLDTPAQQERIASNLLFEKVMERLVVIGKGELDAVLEAEAQAAEEAENAEETKDDVETEGETTTPDTDTSDADDNVDDSEETAEDDADISQDDV